MALIPDGTSIISLNFCKLHLIVTEKFCVVFFFFYEQMGTKQTLSSHLFQSKYKSWNYQNEYDNKMGLIKVIIKKVVNFLNKL